MGFGSKRAVKRTEKAKLCHKICILFQNQLKIKRFTKYCADLQSSQGGVNQLLYCSMISEPAQHTDICVSIRCSMICTRV